MRILLLNKAIVILTVCAWAGSISQAGNTAHDSVTWLVRGLEDPDTTIQRKSADELVNIGEDAIPALIEAMNRHSDDDVSYWVSKALSGIGSLSVPSLIRQLDSANPSVRSCAITTLHQIGNSSKPAAPALVKVLKDKEPRVRERAVTLLGVLGDEAAIKSLVSMLKTEKDEKVRGAAFVALGRFGPKAKEAIPILMATVTNPSSYAGEWRVPSLPGFIAADSLAKIGSESVGPLADVFTDAKQTKMARISASWALGLLKEDACSAVGALVRTLKDPDQDIQEASCMVLEEIGPKAKDAIPHLIGALKDPSSRVQVRSAIALYRINPENKATLPALVRSLKDTAWLVRWQAATGLGWMGPRAKEAVGDLAKLLGDEDSRIRVAAARALGDIGPEATAAMPSLERVLNDNHQDVREWAADAIRRIQEKR